MNFLSSLRRCSFPLFASLMAACGGDGPSAPAPTPGVRATAGANLTDTVDAQPLQALVAEVRGPDGKPASGVIVRFEARAPSDTTRRPLAAVSVCSLAAITCGNSGSTVSDQVATDTTDAQGEAKAIVRLGRVAGRGVILLKVPEFAYLDSAMYTITAGAATRVRVAAAEMNMEIGASATFDASVFDRVGNRRTEGPDLSTSPGTALTVDAASRVVRGVGMGEQWVYAKYLQLADSTRVRVVPPGRLVAWSNAERKIYLLNVSGASRRLLASGISSDFGTMPRFDASGAFVTFHNGTESWGGPPGVAVVTDTLGTTRRDFSNVGFSGIMATRRGADGSVLVVGTRNGVVALWQATATAITQVALLPSATTMYAGADISADGSRVAYTVFNADYTSDIRALDVTRGTWTTIARKANSPRWSAQGDRVAYIVNSTSPGLGVVNADGSNARIVSTASFSPGMAWSPDGQYLLGRNATYYDSPLRLVRLSDGAEMLLRYRTVGNYYDDEYFQLDWH